MKLTQDIVRKMMPGQTLSVCCESVTELNAAQQAAYRGRRGFHGCAVRVQRDSKTLTLTLTCYAEGEQLGGVRKHTTKILTKDCK